MIDEEKRSIDEALRPRIERRAYEIWQSEGSPQGCDVDHWLRAEADITSSSPCTEPTANGESQSTPANGKGKK